MTIRIAWDQDVCKQHGQCEIVAPDLFRLDLDGTVHVTSEVGSERRAEAWAAADACPEQAITIIESEESA